MDFLRTYKNEHRLGDEDDDDDEKEPGPVAAGLDTYAGEWYSRDAGGTFVLAFTDDPKPHLEAIRRRRPPETGDWPVDVVRAPHTESELEAVRARLFEMFEGERIPRAKFIAVLEDFYRRANPDKVANAGTIGWMIDYYEGCEELLYERLEQRYESVPGGPFKVWRTGPPFPAPEAAEPEF